MEKVSIIIPAHNEEKRISKTLNEYYSYLKDKKKHKEFDFELVVVANGCDDNTSKVVKEIGKGKKEIMLLELKEPGKGLSIIYGFKQVLKDKNNSLIGFVDADLATKPNAFYDLIKNIGDYEGIIASRGLKDSIVKTSIKRKLTNRGFNLFVRMMMVLPYQDTQCGAKLFKREAVKRVIDKISSMNWAFDVDLLYLLKKQGSCIREHPTEWQDIEGSKIKMITPIKMASSVIRLRIKYSAFGFIIRLYDKLPESMQIHNL